MKKFLSILLVIAMVASLVAMLIVPTSASTPSSTRKVTADDVTVETLTNGVIGTTAVLFDGVKPEPGYYGGSAEVWDKKANGDYVLVTFDQQVTISELIIHAIGNWPYPTIKAYNALGTEVFSKSFNPNSGDITAMTIVADGDTPIEVKSLKIFNDYDGKVFRLCEMEIQAHFHDYGNPTAEVAPSCGVDGSKTYVCSDCSKTIVEPVAKTNAHIWSTTATETLAPAADREGILQYKCTVNNCPAYKEEKLPCTGHNTTCTRVEADCENDGSVTYVCNDDGCDYELSYVLDKLNHIPASTSTLYKKATIYSNEIVAYECQRDGCDGLRLVEIPETKLDSPDGTTKYLSNDDIVGEIVEVLGANGATDARDKTQLFDGVTAMGDYWSPTNFWSASTGSTLTVTFDKEYIILDAYLHFRSNGNTLKIEYFDAENNPVGTVYQEEISAGVDADTAVPIYGIINQKVKKLVITVVSDKWGQGNKGAMKLSEIQLLAHECVYEQADRENINTVPAECKTTFDGLCRLCDRYATGVVEYNHTFEKETGTEIDKIYITNADETTDYKDATCYTDGKGYKHCTVCNADVDTVIPATGNHDFENGAPVYDDDKAPTCGEGATGHKKCATPGCTAVSEDCDFPATGAHSKWNWKVIEGEEPDYTHTGLKGYFCGVCGYKDTSKEDQVADMTKLNAVSTKDWSVRYTDFVSPRATFKLSKKNIEAIEDEFDVKIFGVVQKGEATKEIQVYGEGATGKVGSDGTFSLVVKGASYTDEYKFSVRIEITCKADNTTAENTVTSKNITTAPDGTVSAKDVATYLIAPNRVDELDAELKKFFEKIAE